MVFCHHPRFNPHAWEGFGPALITALPQTQLSISRQVSTTSTSTLKLYWFIMVLGDRRKQFREKAGYEDKGKVKENLPPLTSTFKKFIIVPFRRKRFFFFLIFFLLPEMYCFQGHKTWVSLMAWINSNVSPSSPEKFLSVSYCTDFCCKFNLILTLKVSPKRKVS